MSTHRGNLVVTNDLQVAGTVGINESNPQGTLQISAVEGTATLVVDGMTDAGNVGVHRRYTKQGEAVTTGTGTDVIATIAMPTNSDRCTVTGMITAYASSGSVTIGGTIVAVAQNIAGTLSIVGTPSVVVMANSAGTPTFTATVSGTNLLINVQGGGENASWAMTYEYQIVNIPA